MKLRDLGWVTSVKQICREFLGKHRDSCNVKGYVIGLESYGGGFTGKLGEIVGAYVLQNIALGYYDIRIFGATLGWVIGLS